MNLRNYILATLFAIGTSQVFAALPPEDLDEDDAKNSSTFYDYYQNDQQKVKNGDLPPMSLGGLDIDKDETFSPKDFLDDKEEVVQGEESVFFCNHSYTVCSCINNCSKKN